MRMLTGTGIVELTGDDTYAHTPKSRVYLQGAAVDFWNLWYVSQEFAPQACTTC